VMQFDKSVEMVHAIEQLDDEQCNDSVLSR